MELRSGTIDRIRMGVLEIFLELLSHFDNFLLPGEIRFTSNSDVFELEDEVTEAPIR